MNIYATLFYTLKDKDYEKNLYKFLNNYKKVGIKDIFLYTDECLPKEFEWLYKDFFQKHRRGYGYWAWKPLIIYDSMKKINDEDFILYHDVGRSCYTFDINYDITPLAKDVKENYGGIGIARGPFSHKEYSKRDAFHYMGCEEKECWDLRQLSATWSLWEKSELPKKILMDWIKWSFDEREIITDLPNKSGLPNFPEFKDNRHDQTIITNLIYLYSKTNPKIKSLNPHGWEKLIDSCSKKYFQFKAKPSALNIKQKENILICIISTKKYENRVDAQVKTFLNKYNDYIVYSDHENLNKNIIKVTEDDTYFGAGEKSVNFLNLIKDLKIENKPLLDVYDWLFFIDDDTYVNINNLKTFVNSLDKNSCYGYTFEYEKHKHFPIYKDEKNKNIKWFQGGAGFLISSNILRNIKQFKNYNHGHGDLTVGYNLSINNINMLHSDLFSTGWAEDIYKNHINTEKIKKQISYHRVNLEDMIFLKSIENTNIKNIIFYCVHPRNLKERDEYIKVLEDNIKSIGYDFNIFDGVIKSSIFIEKDILQNEIINFEFNNKKEQIIFDNQRNAKKFDRKLSQGEIACMLSHFLLWKNLEKNENKLWFILEDDARINISKDQFKLLLDNIPDSNSFDICYFNDRQGHKIKNKINEYYYEVDNGRVGHLWDQMFNGTDGYLITKNGLKKILENFSLYCNADGFLHRWINEKQPKVISSYIKPISVIKNVQSMIWN